MSRSDFLQRVVLEVRDELRRWQPGLERTGRVYRTFLVMASDEWWAFVTTRWTWDAGLLLGGILIGAWRAGIPGALVGIVFVLLGSFLVSLVRAPVRAIDYVNVKRRAAVRDVEERLESSGLSAARAEAGSAERRPPASGTSGASDAPAPAPAREPRAAGAAAEPAARPWRAWRSASESDAPEPAAEGAAAASTPPPVAAAPRSESRRDIALQTLILPPSEEGAPAPAAAELADDRPNRVRAMLVAGLAERADLLALRANGPAGADEASAALSKWLSKYLTLLQRTLADAERRNRLQHLLSLAGDDLEKQARVDAASIEAELGALADEELREDFRPKTWAWKDWSVL